MNIMYLIQDEMCYTTLWYYPAIKGFDCVQHGDYVPCGGKITTCLHYKHYKSMMFIRSQYGVRFYRATQIINLCN